jgi:hypothetical protein
MITKPEVFIIESLKFEDERNKRFEGEIISKILALSGKHCEYYYVRTKKEFREVLKIFTGSDYRYLHLSCHGNDDSMFTTLDSISFSALANILNPDINSRRLFVSACSMANERLARALIPNSGCSSILGPGDAVAFNDAAIFCASLYHVMFGVKLTAMKGDVLRSKARELAEIYNLRLNYFGRDNNDPRGFKAYRISAGKLQNADK